MKKENNKSPVKNIKAKGNAKNLVRKIAQTVMNTAENPIAKRILARNVYAENILTFFYTSPDTFCYFGLTI